MDLVTLANGSTYIPDDLIENYTSLIWTERYIDPGEFELKTEWVEDTLNKMPLDSFVSLLDTKVVMIVESHSIEKKDGVPELTVKGRTFETFLQHRESTGILYTPSIRDNIEKEWYLPSVWENPQLYTKAEAAGFFLWHGIVGVRNLLGLPPHVGSSAPLAELLPNVLVSDSSNTGGSPARKRKVTFGETYTKVLEYLNAGKMGLRIIRPPSQYAYELSYEGNGAPQLTYRASTDKLRFDIYKGSDRTADSGTPLIFSYAAGDFDDATYLRSYKDYKNVAHVMSPLGQIRVQSGTKLGNPEGFARRVLYVDESGYDKEPGEENDEAVTDELTRRGLKALAKHNQTRFLDATISQNSEKIYNTHYGLGDLVTVRGEYGFEADMLVSEYIRTEDSSGETSYPTLVDPNDTTE